MVVTRLPVAFRVLEPNHRFITTQPDAARSDSSRLFLVFVALLPAFKIPKHTSIDGPQSLRSTARINENKLMHQDNKKKKMHNLIYFLFLPKWLHFFVTVISAKIVLHVTKTSLLLITFHFDYHLFQYARRKV
jgi:hypothetical protein